MYLYIYILYIFTENLIRTHHHNNRSKVEWYLHVIFVLKVITFYLYLFHTPRIFIHFVTSMVDIENAILRI